MTDPTPQPLPPHGVLLCCGAAVKLTRTGPGTYTGTEKHLDHCKETA